MKVLILRYSSLGDIILATPVLDVLRDKYLGVRIHWIVNEKFKDAIINNPKIDKVITFTDKSSLIELSEELDLNSYDFVFDLHINRLTKIITSKVPVFYKYNKRVLDRFLLVYFKKKYDKIIPVPHLYMHALRDAGFKIPVAYRPSFFINPGTESRILGKYKMLKDFIAVVPGASYSTKIWPKEYFKQLLEKLQYPAFLLGNGEKEENISRFISQGNNFAFDMVGKLSLEETAVFVKNAKVLLTNDSGLMHLAQCFRTPVVAIFGCTTEEFGFFPYATEHVIMENKELTCRPCTHFGKKYCPKRHFKCMTDISPKMIYNAIKKFL
ncbi:MAG: glycosyltransferase family 9 protein [Candidatus Delongbacteria bacterium]|nr:glycosyltransferase family 9 protein [Candidatus Delongbacteria bacterium]MBN2837088.1 glycosyltransferase family 9 protein [Candidatus Delongbacteria bacterium]